MKNCITAKNGQIEVPLKRKKSRNEDIEFLIELVEGVMINQDFRTLRFSETLHLNTTAYDCLIVKTEKGDEYSISFTKCLQMNRENWEWEDTNYIEESELRGSKNE